MDLKGPQHCLQGKIWVPKIAEAEREGFWSGRPPAHMPSLLFLRSEPSCDSKIPSRKEAGQASGMSTRSTRTDR